MKRYIMIFVAAVALIGACAACTKNNEIFDQSPSARLQQRLSEAQEVLVDQPYGWSLELFPISNYINGGWAFTLKFHGDSVDVQTEVAVNTEQVITSLYKLTTDSGATLSFDTYNTFFHAFSTPNQYLYTAFGGEFEFLVCDVSKDIIKLKGTKTGKTVYLRALEKPATQYISDVSEMAAKIQKLIPTIESDSINVKFRSISTSWRYATIKNLETLSERNVDITIFDKGIRFFEPLDFDGESVSELIPVFSSGKFTGFDTDNGTFIPWAKPDGYQEWEKMDFSGNWNLLCKICTKDTTLVSTKIPVTFEKFENSSEKGYYMYGVYPENSIKFTYLEREGKIHYCDYKLADLPVGKTKYSYMYHTCGRLQYEDKPGVTCFYLYGSEYPDRGMMFAPDGNGNYTYVNNDVYTTVDYPCILVEYFDADLYGYAVVMGNEWTVKGAEEAPSYYKCVVYDITGLEKVK